MSTGDQFVILGGSAAGVVYSGAFAWLPPQDRGACASARRAWTPSQVVYPGARPPAVGYSPRSLRRACNSITLKGNQFYVVPLHIPTKDYRSRPAA